MIATALLTGGPHPFAETTPLLEALLGEEGCEVTAFDDPDQVAAHLTAVPTDLLVLNTIRWRMRADRHAARRGEHGFSTAPATATALDRWVRGGGRLLACHGAPVCFDDWPGWGDILGARWDWARSSHPPLGPFQVQVVGGDHPLVAGLADFTITDECYGFLEPAGDVDIEPLLAGEHGGAAHPLLWTRAVDAGRAVVSLLGHGAASFRHPAHAAILRRAVRWLADPHLEDDR